MPKLTEEQKRQRFYAAIDSGQSRLQALVMGCYKFKTKDAGNSLAYRLIRQREAARPEAALTPELRAVWDSLTERDRELLSQSENTPEDIRGELEYRQWWNSLTDQERQDREEFNEAWAWNSGVEHRILFPGYSHLNTSAEEAFQKVGLSGLPPRCPKCRKIAGSWACKCARKPYSNSGIPQPHPPFSENPGATSRVVSPVTPVESTLEKSSFSDFAAGSSPQTLPTRCTHPRGFCETVDDGGFIRGRCPFCGNLG